MSRPALPARILVVDDEVNNRQALTLLLTQSGYQCIAAESGEVALRLLAEHHCDIVVTDLFMPGISGIDILRHTREKYPTINVILITGHASTESAVEAMKEGAFHYLTKPVNVKELRIQIGKALDKSRLEAENQYLRQQLRGKYSFKGIIGNSPPMQLIFKRMEKVVNTDSTVLILGESGTGKELVARAIHFNSARKDKPFIAINCGAIPGELLESELFGHTKGSFTGASSDKAGKFEHAEGGTIFLDEIGTMPALLQMKLLRVIQEREVERVGSSRKIRLNVRIVSATNADLEEMIADGRFREDLYYRLNVIPIHLPALRERREDIPLLIRHFLKKSCLEQQIPQKTIGDEVMQALGSYDWPGNVREMENVIERAVTLADHDHIGLEDLPPHVIRRAGGGEGWFLAGLGDEGINLPAVVAGIEERLIREALQKCSGVKAKAAGLLGLNRTTLVEKMRRLKIDAE